MAGGGGGVPLGVVCFEKCFCESTSKNKISQQTRDFWYKTFILVFTFLSYTSYHLSRRPLSVVKTVLNRNCSGEDIPPGVVVTNETKYTWCNWAPFDKGDSKELLGTLDSSFLFSYAVAMFFSGFIAERVNLRYFLSMGMLLSGVFTYLFGIGYTYSIHKLWFYIIVQVAGGIVQSSGWPSVVTCCGNWFGKGRRGLIFGVWNSHTSVGNILGAIIAGAFVDYNWGLSFIVPGAIIGVMGFLTFLFLVVYPTDVGCTSPDHQSSKDITSLPPTLCRRRRIKINKSDPDSSDGEVTDDEDDGDDSLLYSRIPDEEQPILQDESGINAHRQKGIEDIKAVSFLSALRIPGVIEFSLCLFFAKLVSYTFLYWLPMYINHSTSFSASDAANLSTFFDVGGIVGGIIAGVISDKTGANASTCTVMFLLAVPLMFLYQEFGSRFLSINIGLLMTCGLFVNGPYALITTAVSAELGTHSSLKGNSKALATVTSIIDGTGSMGAAVGPLMAGMVAGTDWSTVFYLLMVADLCAMVLLTRLTRREVRRLIRQRKDKRHHQVA